MNRRELLRLLLLPGIAGRHLFLPEIVSEATPGLEIHPAEHFQQIRKVLIDNDNMFGARNIVLAVQEQVNTLQRLRQSYRGIDQQKLIQVQIQFAEFCGWLYQDSGDYRAAAYWSGRALEWAHMWDDRDEIAFILARKSRHLAADMGNPALTRAGQPTPRRCHNALRARPVD